MHRFHFHSSQKQKTHTHIVQFAEILHIEYKRKWLLPLTAASAIFSFKWVRARSSTKRVKNFDEKLKVNKSESICSKNSRKEWILKLSIFSMPIANTIYKTKNKIKLKTLINLMKI